MGTPGGVVGGSSESFCRNLHGSLAIRAASLALDFARSSTVSSWLANLAAIVALSLAVCARKSDSMLTANPAAVFAGAPPPPAVEAVPACTAWSPAGAAGGGSITCVPASDAVANACIGCVPTSGAGSADHATRFGGGFFAPTNSMSAAACPYPITQTKISCATGHNGSMWTTFLVVTVTPALLFVEVPVTTFSQPLSTVT